MEERSCSRKAILLKWRAQCKLISSSTLAAVFCKWLCSLKLSIRRWNYTCQFSESDCHVQGPQELHSHLSEKAWTIRIAYRTLCILICIRGKWAYDWPASGRTIDAEADSIWAINGFGLICVKQIWAVILTKKIFYCCLRRYHWRIVPSHTSHGCCGYGSTTKSRCCCCNVRFSTTMFITNLPSHLHPLQNLTRLIFPRTAMA